MEGKEWYLSLTRQSIGPARFEPIVCTEIDDGTLSALGDGSINSVDEGLADAVGQSHDPGVNFIVFCHFGDILCGKVGVADLGLCVFRQRCSSQLSGRDVGELEMRVVVDQ